MHWILVIEMSRITESLRVEVKNMTDISHCVSMMFIGELMPKNVRTSLEAEIHDKFQLYTKYTKNVSPLRGEK